MEKECQAASWFWTSQLVNTVQGAEPLTKEQIIGFQTQLERALMKKYEGHWYPEEPDRGHAFRSIWADDRCVDKLLLDAAKRCGINLRSRIHVSCIMWCDPGSVKLQYLHEPKVHVLYEQANPGINNSPSRKNSGGARSVPGMLHFERTVLSVTNRGAA